MPPIQKLGYLFHEEVQKIDIKDPHYPHIAEERHNNKIRELETELQKTEKFREILPFYFYSTKEISGEVDLLAIGEKSEWYEVKYRHSRRKLKESINRFQKFKQAFPKFNGRGYYISCDGITIEITNLDNEEL